MSVRLLSIVGLFLSIDTFASDPPQGPFEWDRWTIQTHMGYCELQLQHRAIVPPFYPDVLIRFHVPTIFRDGRPNESDYKYGELVLWLYSYIPNVPKENRPLHRIESAKFGKKAMKKTILGVQVHDDIYRVFELRGTGAWSVFEELGNEHHRSVKLVLQLADGSEVVKRVPPGQYFNTQARMLSVCMEEGFSH